MSQTSERDPKMATSLTKIFCKKSKNRIDRSWHTQPDKLLDKARHVTQIMEMVVIATESGTPIDWMCTTLTVLIRK